MRDKRSLPLLYRSAAHKAPDVDWLVGQFGAGGERESGGRPGCIATLKPVNRTIR